MIIVSRETATIYEYTDTLGFNGDSLILMI
jgi:hypothetical protein